MQTITLSVEMYFNLMENYEMNLQNGATCGWGAVYNGDGEQLHNSDIIEVEWSESIEKAISRLLRRKKVC